MYEVDHDMNPHEHEKIPESSINFITPPDECESFESLFASLEPEFKKLQHQYREDETYYVATVTG
ncbi:MAG: hypothetical protein SXQ77_09880 [Halobacteria archaeon]|nr:hypothetical protein [Halobacteria archaeon]